MGLPFNVGFRAEDPQGRGWTSLAGGLFHSRLGRATAYGPKLFMASRDPDLKAASQSYLVATIAWKLQSGQLEDQHIVRAKGVTY